MEQWKQVLHLISERISKPSFETWLKNTTAEIKDDVVIVKTKNEFQADWLEERYKTMMIETIKEVTGHTMEVEITGQTIQKNMEFQSSKELPKSAFDELKGLILAQQKKIQELEDRIARLEQK
ncbi:hypothetical protein HHO41_12785 [Bacillus sp. DNRA2]|uniref:DnaA N-terminal domain-containing protein n=1 Tax=Bacillus sp. DNRA2 TaxID=2723053 RepID=UPI00145FAC50|nr:DnaA N-terminal domain-containing protein [Bacillus sp. DNRA2]NMD71176.1 hypothetical protein [Bacillus sp. DNRA2]